MTNAEICKIINSLPRYDEVSKSYYTTIAQDEGGDYVRIDDLAKALGLIHNWCSIKFPVSIGEIIYNDEYQEVDSGQK